MSGTFCQICRHPSPGHFPTCPVETGEPQRGSQIPQEFMQSLPQIQNNQPAQFGSQFQQNRWAAFSDEEIRFLLAGTMLLQPRELVDEMRSEMKRRGEGQ